jgi:hypothetical protein
MAQFVGVSNQALGYPYSYGSYPLSYGTPSNLLSTRPLIGNNSGNIMSGISPSYNYPNALGYAAGMYPNKLVPETVNSFVPGVVGPSGMNPAVAASMGYPIGTNVQMYDKLDVNYDPDLRNRTVKYFKHKTLKWINSDSDFQKVLNYFVIRTGDGKKYVDLVKDIKEYKKENKDSEEIIKMKIEFIRKFVLSKKLVAKILEKFGNKYDVKWWNFKSNKESIKETILHELKKKIKNNIAEE